MMKTPLVIALAMVAAGCGSLTETSASQILSSNLFTPSNAGLLAGSVVADFECAYADYAAATGIVSDELGDAQLSQAVWDYDRRTLHNTSPLVDNTCPNSTQGPGVWAPLSTARFDGDNLLGLLNGWTNAQVANRVQLIGQTAAYTGYALTLMGETMCAGAVDGGPKLTPDSLLGLADTHFGTAITNATTASDASTLTMAYLGRARERLDRGKAVEAAADAAQIPPAYVKVATYDASSTRRENRIWTIMWRDFFFTVDVPFHHRLYDTSATTIDTVVHGTDTTIGPVHHGVPDPRVVVDSEMKPGGGAVIGPDQVTAIWGEQKYQSISDPIPIGHYSEAQLIIAEAQLKAGNANTAINIINALHAAAGLPPYNRTNNPDSVMALIINERAAELFLEGHRLADMIRYGQTFIPLYPAAGTLFKDGGTFGTQLCFPLPVIENGT
jgi:hypothetical protein